MCNVLKIVPICETCGRLFPSYVKNEYICPRALDKGGRYGACGFPCKHTNYENIRDCFECQRARAEAERERMRR